MNIEKITELKQWMSRENVECAYISDPTHIAYFSGFSSHPHERVLALFIPLNQSPFLFVPALELGGVEESSWSGDYIGYLDSENPWQIIGDQLKQRGLKENTVFAIEKGQLVIDRLEQMTMNFPKGDFSKDLTPFIQRMQLIKTEDEVQKLYDAGVYADLAFEIGFKLLSKDITEREVVAEIEYALKKKGIKEMSFDTIVLSGENASSPHGVSGANKIQPNKLVLFDLGVVWNQYNSDATRTVSFGEPSDFDRKIYDICLESQLAAMDAVKPGITASELDQVARNVIAKAGYGEYFTHRLGHGIGTTVHEFPSIVEGNDLVIEEGMCFSIEPGIYIPNKVGVRIEDCVHVTKDGCKPFTTTPKTLQIIGK